MLAYVGLGSNLGNRQDWLERAIEALRAQEPVIRVLRVSPSYESPPLLEGQIAEQEPDPEHIPWFLNAVIELETSLDPVQLLEHLTKVENQLGRRRSDTQSQIATKSLRVFLSRNIDLDLLFYGNEVLESEQLTVPHPRAHRRSFVLLPMRDLRSDYVHPVLKQTIAELCKQPLQPAPIRRAERS